jgi:acetyltransferase-like isoleucine patch superfamily enzyme
MEHLRRAVAHRRLQRRFPDSDIYSGVSASGDSVLGHHSVLFRDVMVLSSQIGAYTYVQARTALFNAEIGAFCSIASDVTIGLAAHPTSMVSTSPVFYDNAQPLPFFFTKERLFTNNLPRTTIGADVWIGQGALVKAGVAIGVGSVIGAAAVVTKDVRPYDIVGGNPARRIRSRFSEEIAAALEASSWWTLSEPTLMRLAAHFANPEEFCRIVAEVTVK